jgi:riboflavin kinase / FMN adenylyltransferase
MQITRELHLLPEPRAGTVAAIGNFDGVHLAHQKLLRSVVESAQAIGATPTAITFEPHPAKILAPERAPRLLTPLERKARLIGDLGIELLVVLPFTQELAHVSPLDFVRRILVEKLRVRSLHVGPDFHFGYQRTGNVTMLGKLARQEGFGLEILPALEIRKERVSSRRIRQLLDEGRVQMACRLLGRPHSNQGSVVRGSGIGRERTVPTLNLSSVEEQLPRIGVYVTRTRLTEGMHDSVTNVGHKPTFGPHRLTVESYLLNFAGQATESAMEVEFLYRLRDEMKFPDAVALKTQIQKDVRRALKFFRLLRLLQQRPAQRATPAKT